MLKGNPPQYRGKCSKCGGERDGSGRYCLACDAAYRRDRRKARTNRLHELEEFAREHEGTKASVTFQGTA